MGGEKGGAFAFKFASNLPQKKKVKIGKKKIIPKKNSPGIPWGV